MIALDLIAAAGGLCGAVALLRQSLAARDMRRRQLAALNKTLAAWDELHLTSQIEAWLELGLLDQERVEQAVERDPAAILGDLRDLVSQLEPRRPGSAGCAGASPSPAAASASTRKSAAALLQAARQVLEGRSHV